MYRFSMTGLSPFLFRMWNNHPWPELQDECDSLPLRSRTSKARAGDIVPVNFWRTLIALDSTHLILPHACIESALMNAARFSNCHVLRIIKKSTIENGRFSCATSYGRLRQVKLSSIEAIPMDLGFRDQMMAMRLLGMNAYIKRSHCSEWYAWSKCHRLCVRCERWKVSGLIDTSMRPDVLAKLFECAGDNVGVGDWRPNFGTQMTGWPIGPFGRFKAKITQVA